MIIMESRNNSIEDERHYIGNLLDDDGPIGSVLSANDSGAPMTIAATITSPALRGRKSYRDVASVNRSGSSTTSVNSSSISYLKLMPSASCELLQQPQKQQRAKMVTGQFNSQQHSGRGPTTPFHAFNSNFSRGGGLGTRSLNRSNCSALGAASQSQPLPTKAPPKILGLNPVNDSSTKLTKKVLSRKQKSASDFQRINSSGKKRNGLMFSNLSVNVNGEASKSNSAQSVPSTPASHSPPVQIGAESSMIGGGLPKNAVPFTNSFSNTKSMKKADEFISVSYGSGKNRVEDQSSSTAANKVGADQRSRFEVLKKIGSLYSPNYENILSAIRDSSSESRRPRRGSDNNSSSSKRTIAERGRSMSIQDVEFSRSTNRNKTTNSNRGRSKAAENGGVTRNVRVDGSNNSITNVIRYLIFAVASVFSTQRCNEDNENDVNSNGTSIGGTDAALSDDSDSLYLLVMRLFVSDHARSSASVSGNSIATRRKARKAHQKAGKTLHYLYAYSTTVWKATYAGVLWIINLLVDFVVLLFLAIVVVFKQILSCF